MVILTSEAQQVFLKMLEMTSFRTGCPTMDRADETLHGWRRTLAHEH
jgi:hypothetical protein